jgi:hypothetical protein
LREVDLGIVIATSLVYFILFFLVFLKHGEHIVKLNKILLISWFVEAVLSVAVTTFSLNHGIKSMNGGIFFNIWTLVSTLNFILFIYIMFWLKSIQIYMDKENRTGQEIREKLSRLKTIRKIYCIAIGVSSFSGQVAVFAKGLFRKVIESQKFALINLNVQIFLLFISCSVHFYLIKMGITMQRILREYRLIEGYKGECVLISTYTIHFLSAVIRQFIIMPVLLLKINSSHTHCSHQVTSFMQVIYLAFRVGWPLSFQILFMAVMR